MKNGIILAAFMAALCASAETVKTATQPWVRAYVASNHVDITGKADSTNVYTKAETDAKIVELSPPTSLEASTNYTDRALGAFASTGTVARANVYGTPTRWTDATGCVWEVTPGWRVYTNGVVAVGWTAWDYAIDATADGVYWGLMIGLEIDAGGIGYTVAEQMFPQDTAPHWDAELSRVYEMDSDYNGLMPGDAIRAVRGETNLVGRVALTNDIPDVSGCATQQQATNAAVAVVDSAMNGLSEAIGRKQDALPYPTNAIPYAAITGAPSSPSVFYDAAGGADTFSGATLIYQAASNSVGYVALLAGTNVLHITAPSAITGHVRDFGLTVSTEDAATITLDSSVSWRFDAANTNLAAGSWNRVYCTESPTGVFSLQLWTPDSAQEATP